MVKVTGLPRPTPREPEGVNDVMTSGSPARTAPFIAVLPALATKTLELFGRIAAWVGLIPILACPILLSPETSICSAVPGFGATLLLIPNTAWKFAGFGGLLAMGIT